MVSSSGSGATSGSTQLANSGSDGDHRQAVDPRKQRRMLSNRESARRSRMRKQKYLDDLTAQMAQIRRENNQILAGYKATTQQYLAVEAENSILRTQITELSNRLDSLREILQYMNGANSRGSSGAPPQPAMDDFFMTTWSSSVNHSIMASADMFQY